MAKMIVYQDGPNVYLEGEGHIWTAPFPVKDSDMAGAIKARELFEEYAKRKGWEVEWDQ